MCKEISAYPDDMLQANRHEQSIAAQMSWKFQLLANSRQYGSRAPDTYHLTFRMYNLVAPSKSLHILKLFLQGDLV